MVGSRGAEMVRSRVAKAAAGTREHAQGREGLVA